MSRRHSSMLSNVRNFFKKGASSPSSKDRPSSFSSEHEHASYKARGPARNSQSPSQGRNVREVSTNCDSGLHSSRENSRSNEHSSYGLSPASPTATGFDAAYTVINRRLSPAAPSAKKQNHRPITDHKVLQLLGPTADEEGGIAKWMEQAPPRADGSSEFSLPPNDDSDEVDSYPDSSDVSWPQKSELPTSFEFAKPVGKPENGLQDHTDVFPYADMGITSSPSRLEVDLPPPFPFRHPNRPYGEEIFMGNGAIVPNGEETLADCSDDISRVPRSPSHPKSLRPTVYSSSRALVSPRGSIHSPEGWSRDSNAIRPEAISWGSAGSHSPKWANGVSHSPKWANGGSQSPKWANGGSLSPKWANSGEPSSKWGNGGEPSPKWDNGGLPSPERMHPLPEPPQSSSALPQLYLAQNVNLGRGSGRNDSCNAIMPRERHLPPLVLGIQAPSPNRASPRLGSYPSPGVSPLPSPPRSPLQSPRVAPFPHVSFAPLPTPPTTPHPNHQSPPRSPSRMPKTLKKWKKIKQIGTGSFGTVHEAINLEDGSFFAVKVSHDESIPAEIQKEIEVLSMLRHPNVVQYFGTSMEDGHLCIFLELMQNSLQSIIKVFHHFDETLISTYTRQILQGLEYLHQKNTIHRDIKCANILVDKDGQVKLADFGLAKEVGMSLATSCKGTPYFMAPEILKPHPNSKRGYGLPVDIWSLGCTVLEMADGQPPWSFLKGFSFFFKLNKGELPPIPEHLSLVCKDFIRQCLQFKPEDRPTASKLLSHAFVANAPATVPAAVSLSPSPAAMLMMTRRSGHDEGSEGRNAEVSRQSRNGSVNADVQGSDIQHHKPILQRSQRLDRSLNRSHSNPRIDALQLQDILHSPALVSSPNHSGQHYGR